MTENLLLPNATSLDYRNPASRLAKLLDPDSVVGLPLGDTGSIHAVRGRVEGSPVLAYCTDGSVMGGAIGAAECAGIVTTIETAVSEGCPVIGLWHSAGARLREDVDALEGIGRMFATMTGASGLVPQISVILGPAAGGAAYGPALTDLVIMAPEARVFVTGPDVVRSVTGEQIDMEGLGGPDAHDRRSGVVHIIADSEDDAYLRARRITSLLDQQGSFDPLGVQEPRNLRMLLPDSPRLAYDVRPLIRLLLDSGPGAFAELQARWAPNMVVGLGRLGGRTVGVIANNPVRKGGCLDSLSAEKAARFVRMCDSFGVPLIVLADVPGYLPGVRQEWEGVVRRGAKLLYAFSEAAVPRVTLITRKAFGGAYIAMNSRALGATAVFAWPECEVAIMGAEAAVNVLNRRVLEAAPDEVRAALRATLVKEHEAACGGVKRALAVGAIDEVIDPSDTRRRLAEALAGGHGREHGARGEHGGHGNIPL